MKSFDADLRLSRRDGDIQFAIAHKPSDLLSAGDAGSQAAAIAKDMLHLADTKILHGQDQAVADELQAPPRPARHRRRHRHRLVPPSTRPSPVDRRGADVQGPDRAPPGRARTHLDQPVPGRGGADHEAPRLAPRPRSSRSLVGVPIGAIAIATTVVAPAVAEQIRIDPCSAYTDQTNIDVTGGEEAGVGFELPKWGSPRHQSLHSPAQTIPARIKKLYVAAARRYQVPWQLLAGIGMAETRHGRNNRTSSAGAQGLMQFMPGTFAAYGVDGNRDGRRDIHNDADSIFSAANYLTESGVTRGSSRESSKPCGPTTTRSPTATTSCSTPGATPAAAAASSSPATAKTAATGSATATPTCRRSPQSGSRPCSPGPRSRRASPTSGEAPARSGYDCSGFVGAAFRQIGIRLPRTAESMRLWAHKNAYRVPPSPSAARRPGVHQHLARTPQGRPRDGRLQPRQPHQLGSPRTRRPDLPLHRLRRAPHVRVLAHRQPHRLTTHATTSTQRRFAMERTAARRSSASPSPARRPRLIPYLVGFTPEESLVVSVVQSGRVQVTARVDLADVQRPAASKTSSTGSGTGSPTPTGFAVAYTADHQAGWNVLRPLRRVAARRLPDHAHRRRHLAHSRRHHRNHRPLRDRRRPGHLPRPAAPRPAAPTSRASFASPPDSDELDQQLGAALADLPGPSQKDEIVALTRELIDRNLPPVAEPAT